MEKDKVSKFLSAHLLIFPSSKSEIIQNALEKSDNNRFETIQSAGFRNAGIAAILALLFPGIGLDRFLTGKIIIGLARISSMIAGIIALLYLNRSSQLMKQFAVYPIIRISIWYIFEIITASSRTKQYNYFKLMFIITED